MTFVFIHRGAEARGKVDALEQGSCPRGGGSVVIPRVREWDAVDLGPI
jgi:hypothetical protein